MTVCDETGAGAIGSRADASGPRSRDTNRILAVEDDQTVGVLVSLALRRAGHHVRLVVDLYEARQALRDEEFDLVLTEVNLPDGSGFDLLHHMRHDLGLEVPAIILSGIRQKRNIERGAPYEVVELITKPFSPRHLVESVGRALGS